MWNQLKQYGRGLLRKLGLIKELKSLKEHKQINVDEEEYNRIDFNKRLYQGHVKEWHDLRYKGTMGMIERRQMTLNMPKVLAKKMARLVMNEGVNISLAKNSEKENQWELVKGVFNSNKFIREFQRYLEYMFAMGGVALEVYLDGEKPKIAYATADAFFPLSNDTEQVDEAVIANQFKDGENYYTLLKWHEWGDFTDEEGETYNYRIKNELFVSKKRDVLGERESLSSYFEDMESVTYFNRESPLFIYIKPNEANNKNISSPLGISVFENAYDTIRMLDVMYDFWYNEFRLGKRRVAVPEYLVKTAHDRNGTPYVYFDDSEELFVAMNSSEMEDMQIKDLTVDLRVEQVVDSIQAMLDMLSMQVGLSAGTFTFTNQGMKTATQVVSENSETYQTRASHLSVIEDALRDLIVAVYEVVTLDDDEDDKNEPLDRMDISIDFNDGVFTDSQSLYNYWAQGYKDGLVPMEQALKRIYKLSDDEAKEWAEGLSQDGQRNVLTRRRALAQAELELER
jgi:A118 family predicted phage portal protein